MNVRIPQFISPSHPIKDSLKAFFHDQNEDYKGQGQSKNLRDLYSIMRQTGIKSQGFNNHHIPYSSYHKIVYKNINNTSTQIGISK